MNWFSSSLFAAALLCAQPALARETRPVHGMDRVSTGIFRGAQPKTQMAVKRLADHGVQTVIDLQGGDYSGNKLLRPLIPLWESGETPADIAQEKAWVEKSGMRFFSMPLNSMKPVDRVASERIDEILRLMHDSKLQPVYVHCAHGCDRTGLIVALYRIKYEDWPADLAYAEMRMKGHTLANMTTTWPMDAYFFKYARKLARTRPAAEMVNGCSTLLSF